MNLNDEFEVPLGVAEAWAVLTDIEKITPYLPGIWLREVEDEKYQGVVKVKVGPVTMWYEGVARYLLLDADAHKAVLKAEGGEIHGQGNGSALVTASLSPSARGTRVQVVTVLSIDGRLAQFADDVTGRRVAQSHRGVRREHGVHGVGRAQGRLPVDYQVGGGSGIAAEAPQAIPDCCGDRFYRANHRLLTAPLAARHGRCSSSFRDAGRTRRK